MPPIQEAVEVIFGNTVLRAMGLVMICRLRWVGEASRSRPSVQGPIGTQALYGEIQKRPCFA